MSDPQFRITLRRLRRAYDAMPEPARAVFDRHRFADLGYREIAAELGIDVAEVERQLAQALAHLMRETVDPDDGTTEI